MRDAEMGNVTSETALANDPRASIEMEPNQQPHPMPSAGYDDMEEELVIIGTDIDEGAHDVLSRSSYERKNAEREEELVKMRDSLYDESL